MRNKISNKATKIALIHFLSNPKIKVTYWQVNRPTLTITENTGWDMEHTTGVGTVEIQFSEKGETE